MDKPPIGFRDGRPGQPNFKEYTGSRLLQKIVKGETYRLDLFVGFHSDPSSASFEFAIFASPDPNSIPFGQGNENFGCPTNGPDFDQLGVLNVSGRDEWINVVFEFVADQDYEVIVIGPGCDPNPNFNDDPYFYFDRITIARLSEFVTPFTQIIGDLCGDSIILNLEDELAIAFQWYKDGVAIIGETSSTLEISTSDEYGDYNVLVTTEDGCFLSENFELGDGSIIVEETIEICEGESVIINNEEVFVSGNYTEVIPITDICDSIVEKQLIVHPNVFEEVFDTICEYETYIYKTLNVTEAGDYDILETTEFGCEFKTTVHLFVEDNLDGLELGNNIEINLGDYVNLTPQFLSPEAVTYQWSDLLNGVISNDVNTGSIQPYQDQYYYFSAYNSAGCGLNDSIFVRVSEDLNVFIPNVFSPLSNDTNNTFSIGVTNAIREITEFLVFDRWGNIVFRSSGDINNFEFWKGFDTEGKLYEQGIYTYLIELTLINSKTTKYAGDLLLLH